MKSKRRISIITLLMTAVLLLSSTLTVWAADTDDYTDTANNYYFSGEDKIVEGGMFFSGFGAGKDLKVQNCKSDDSIAMAGLNLTVADSKIGGSVYLAGNGIKVNGSDVKGNVIAAGNSISVDSDTVCNGVLATGREVTFDGEAKALTASAQTVVVNGTIEGDAEISAEKVEIGDGAVVTGNLKIEAKTEPIIPAGAKIGELEFEKTVEDQDNKDSEKKDDESTYTIGQRFAKAVKSTIYWSVAMAVIGLLLFTFGRKHLEQSASMVRERTGAMFGSGAIALITVPIVSVICMITVIGIPTAMITATMYVLLICVSVTFAGASLGPVFLKKMPALLASVLGIVILEVLKKIPYVGILIKLAAVLYTMGYFIQYIYMGRTKKQKRENVVETAETLPELIEEHK